MHLALTSVGRVVRRHAPFFSTKKLAIIGCTLSRQFAPWTDPSWTIASHCSSRRWCLREPDWYFDLHPRSCFQHQVKSWHPNYYHWLQRLQTPIFMQEAWDDIPMAVRYPKERILAEYRAYFTNHVAWMIALAMTEGVTHLGLFGCQYGAATEYALQRGSCEYWLGRFEQAGGQVILPPKWSDLLAKPSELYGYESHDLKTGKLVDSYRVPIPIKTPAGETVQLQVLDPATPSKWPPLAPLPDGPEPTALTIWPA